MTDQKKSDNTALKDTLLTTIALLHGYPFKGKTNSPPQNSIDIDPNAIPSPEEEAEAFDSPSQENIDEIQDLDNATVRWQLDRQQIQNSKLSEEVESLKAETRNNNAKARGRNIDNRLRLQMATSTFRFMQFWCGFVAFIVFLYVARNDGKPEKEVIIALMGTSTISIVGLVGFVVSGLFKSPKSDDKEK
ncbi:DUF2681 domain-containing protein [Pantoea sp. Fr-CA_6]|uniref:DUF2681 domain-containing protein n=1 Tax=Pantoea sp. Fr-CA_6 TaxID=2929505 RepID=UPI002119A08A|nr:DUF2681 domain-containing protein [Pantoea sp. Fr-CA_6]